MVIGTGGKNIPRAKAMDHVAGLCLCAVCALLLASHSYLLLLCFYKGYVLALDMTARDWQESAKKAGLPWSTAKGCDTFCPVSPLISKQQIANPNQTQLWLKVGVIFVSWVELDFHFSVCSLLVMAHACGGQVNGVQKQNGNTNQMIWPIDALIEHISTLFTLTPGDLILTGTPEGVGPVKAGDTVTAGITGVVEVDWKVEAAPEPPKYVVIPSKL